VLGLLPFLMFAAYGSEVKVEGTVRMQWEVARIYATGFFFVCSPLSSHSNHCATEIMFGMDDTIYVQEHGCLLWPVRPQISCGHQAS
jgi:hypothetical protein